MLHVHKTPDAYHEGEKEMCHYTRVVENRSFNFSSPFFFLAIVTGPAPEVVQRHQGSWLNAAKTTTLEEPVFDMVVCGGTLGVFLATTLALRGFKVALIEKGPLRGVCMHAVSLIHSFIDVYLLRQVIVNIFNCSCLTQTQPRILYCQQQSFVAKCYFRPYKDKGKG
jgi:hypothetical protein